MTDCQRRTLYAVLSVLLCAGSVVAGAQPSRQQPLAIDAKAPVLYGVTISRDSVTVGDPFDIRVRVRAPAGASIRFPDNPDTAGTVQARDPRTILTADSVKQMEQIAVYHVAAWNVGKQRVRLGDVIVTMGPKGSAEQRVPLLNVFVYVQSVLPADSAKRVPKPARPLWEAKPFPWWIVALLLVALAIALWWWMRRRRQKPAPVVPAVDPYQRAAADFARIEAMGLVDAGERTRFVSLVIEVLRDYLAARVPDARLSLTSKELVSALRRSPTVSAEALSRTLHDADLAKFAGMALAEDRARAVARDARSIVDQEHSTSQPQPGAQAAA